MVTADSKIISALCIIKCWDLTEKLIRKHALAKSKDELQNTATIYI
jgi:hypothetical protein